MGNSLVKRAARYFDRHYPGWFKRDRVKLSKLNPGDGEYCITGQLGLGEWDREDLPLYVREATGWKPTQPVDRTRKRFQEPWENEIRARRKAARA